MLRRWGYRKAINAPYYWRMGDVGRLSMHSADLTSLPRRRHNHPLAQRSCTQSPQPTPRAAVPAAMDPGQGHSKNPWGTSAQNSALKGMSWWKSSQRKFSPATGVFTDGCLDSPLTVRLCKLACLLVYLLCQLPGGRQHQPHGPLALLNLGLVQDVHQHGQDEGSGLATAGLGEPLGVIFEEGEGGRGGGRGAVGGLAGGDEVGWRVVQLLGQCGYNTPLEIIDTPYSDETPILNITPPVPRSTSTFLSQINIHIPSPDQCPHSFPR